MLPVLSTATPMRERWLVISVDITPCLVPILFINCPLLSNTDNFLLSLTYTVPSKSMAIPANWLGFDKRADKLSAGGEHLHTMVEMVCNIHITIGTTSYAIWLVELPIVVAPTTKFVWVGEVTIQYLDAVIASVSDEHFTRGRVHHDALWMIELKTATSFLSSRSNEFNKLSLKCEHLYFVVAAISNKEIVVMCEGNTTRRPELSCTRARWSKRPYLISFFIQHKDTVTSITSPLLLTAKPCGLTTPAMVSICLPLISGVG